MEEISDATFASSRWGVDARCEKAADLLDFLAQVLLQGPPGPEEFLLAIKTPIHESDGRHSTNSNAPNRLAWQPAPAQRPSMH
jgi:hypothetical protein